MARQYRCSNVTPAMAALSRRRRALYRDARWSAAFTLPLALSIACGGVGPDDNDSSNGPEGELLSTTSQALTQAGWLLPGEELLAGEGTSSIDGRYVLWMQTDGNLVLYGPEGPIYASRTSGQNNRAIMQEDGNFVVYDSASRPLWHTSTHGLGVAGLAVQNDGNLVIYAPDRYTPLWASRGMQPSASQESPPGWLVQGSVLRGGEGLSSPNGAYVLWMQEDGNLVLYGPSGALFSSSTVGRGAQVEMQYDGNLVVYDAGHTAVWASGTSGHPGAFLAVQDDGNLVVYAADQATPLWSRAQASPPDTSTPPESTPPAAPPPPQDDPAPSAGVDTNVTDYLAYVLSSSLKVRSGPGTDFDTAHLLPGRRSVVTVTHHNGAWARIRFREDRETGYVHRDYLERAEANLAAGCRLSDMPEVGDWLYSKMWRHITGVDGTLAARQVSAGDSLLTSLVVFYEDVKTGGPFDLKNNLPLSNHAKCGVRLFGRPVANDVPGNIHYGFEGVKFLESHYVSPPTTRWTLREFLLAAAGTAQLASNRDWERLVSVFRNVPIAGYDFVHKLRELDNPCDAHSINVGVDHASEKDFESTIKAATMRDPRGWCTTWSGR